MLLETIRVNLTYPVFMLGSRRERYGQRAHVTYSIALRVLHAEHGKPPERCEGEWKEARETPTKFPQYFRRWR
jgi:hypothetical protein